MRKRQGRLRNNIDSSIGKWIDADRFTVRGKEYSVTTGRHLTCAYCDKLIESMGQMYKHKLYHTKCCKIVKGVK